MSLINRFRSALYRIAREYIAPVSSGPTADVGSILIDDGSIDGSYSGSVSIPPASSLSDACALALLLSAQWVAAFSKPRQRTALKTSYFAYNVVWRVEIVRLDDDAPEPEHCADPSQIKAVIESMLAATDPVEAEDPRHNDTPVRGDGVVLPFRDTRNRLREEE
jgi:hypothetical protein